VATDAQIILLIQASLPTAGFIYCQDAQIILLIQASLPTAGGF
jgi:hypothetical protein